MSTICVDLSSSTDERCEFNDVQNSEDAEADIQPQERSIAGARETPPIGNSVFILPDPDELQEYIRSHESYDDFLAIVGTGNDD